MAESARRIGGSLGSGSLGSGNPGNDLARRLIAQPIRRQAALSARAVPVKLSPLEAEPQPQPDQSTFAEPEPAGDLTRQLESQIMVMKAVLKAERHENDRLRSCLDLDGEEELGAEARAVRERWAGIVDRLLHDSL